MIYFLVSTALCYSCRYTLHHGIIREQNETIKSENVLPWLSMPEGADDHDELTVLSTKSVPKSEEKARC